MIIIQCETKETKFKFCKRTSFRFEVTVWSPDIQTSDLVLVYDELYDEYNDAKLYKQ